MSEPCRCGHPAESTDPHPCHGRGYECGKPAKSRMYHQPGPIRYSLAGAQMKLSMSRTWACDECWAEYEAKYLKPPAGDAT